MKTLRFTADVEIEAEGITDGFGKLARHFQALANERDPGVLGRGTIDLKLIETRQAFLYEDDRLLASAWHAVETIHGIVWPAEPIVFEIATNCHPTHVVICDRHEIIRDRRFHFSPGDAFTVTLSGI